MRGIRSERRSLPRSSWLGPRARKESPQPLRLKVDYRQQEHPQRQLPGVGREFKRVVLDELERDRTNQGREHAAGPAQYRDENEIARRDPECKVRRHMADEVGDQSAAKAADGPGDDIGRQDGMACGRAEIFNAGLVVAHGLNEIAEWGG